MGDGDKQHVYTHDAGAELLVCDVQRVSVSVKPPACPVFARPIPAFQVRHLSGLKQAALLKKTYTDGDLCVLYLPGSYV